eukprot:Phypoly_transcript_08721.p1 GENE.Phypoly_transcript_08721~~Phypoly_transcript_08721.p1  ORF type:complete len:383 (+),score=81.77 Phypoly_transcript_08721:284-1432(+)
MKTLLVVGGNPNINWYKVFENAKIHDEEEVTVEMAHWDEINIVSYSDSGVQVSLTPASKPHPNTTQGSHRHIKADFLLIRSANRGVFGQDWRNILYGFLHSNVPSINTLQSLYLCQEKPIVYGILNQIKKKHGAANFPLIDQTYYEGFKVMTFSTGFPLVAKIGTAHAGFGKMKIEDSGEFEDFRSVVAMQDKYVTAEPFIKWNYDFRIQKIGTNYRAFRRVSTNWKGKGMNQHDEDVEVNERYKMWIDEASAALGMDICAMDGVHSMEDDKEYIIELNDSAIGLINRHQEEDLLHIRDLVLARMATTFPKKDAPIPAPATPEEKDEKIRKLEEQIAVLQSRLSRQDQNDNSNSNSNNTSESQKEKDKGKEKPKEGKRFFWS